MNTNNFSNPITNVKPSTQIHSNYTTEDFEVWKTLFERQTLILEPIVSKEYLEALTEIGFVAGKVPNFAEVNEILKIKTGWSIKVVPNIAEAELFFTSLAHNQFTSTCWLRTKAQLDYLEEPDMFHDVFGHIPLLTNSDYTKFYNGIAAIAIKYSKKDSRAYDLISKIYWATIEFGLIREGDEIKVYGAGIISSKGEVENVLAQKENYINFDIQTVFDTDFISSEIQTQYFVTESFEKLSNSLPEIEKLLVQNLSVK
jgi:phenylalanine-4-hydroxylase